MPSGRTHAVAGALAGTFLMAYAEQPAVVVVAAALGGLLPDVDHRHSLLGRFGFWWLIFKHRGFTHSLVCWFIVSNLAMLFLPTEWGLGICVGYISHLALDFRVPWLWPAGRKRRKRHVPRRSNRRLFRRGRPS